MCTRFVYRGEDILTGFNFDIDLSVWNHQVVREKDRFYIGILRPDGVRHENRPFTMRKTGILNRLKRRHALRFKKMAYP